MKCKCGNFMQLINGHWICSCGHKIKYCEEITAGLNALASEIHDNAVDKGFYDTPPEVGVRLMEIVSEASEALEADKNNSYTNWKLLDNDLENIDDIKFKIIFEGYIKNNLEDELCDIIIRTLDYCAYRKIDIEKHVKYKMRYNSTRERLHGKRY